MAFTEEPGACSIVLRSENEEKQDLVLAHFSSSFKNHPGLGDRERNSCFSLPLVSRADRCLGEAAAEWPESPAARLPLSGGQLGPALHFILWSRPLATGGFPEQAEAAIPTPRVHSARQEGSTHTGTASSLSLLSSVHQHVCDSR